MAQQIINVGSAPNDGTGDTLRNSQIKVNANITELYNAVDLKLDKVTTVDVEKVYIKNADGTQGMKPVSDFGGSSVQSVTGDSVDNTDTLNPIINAIPLSGTTVGNPVTGDIEIQSGYADTKIYKNHEDEDWKGRLVFSDSAFQLVSENFDNTLATSLNIYKDKLQISSSNPISRGLEGVQDFTPNITDLDYVQKKYVDTKVSKVTSSGVERAYIINADGSQGTKATSEWVNANLDNYLVNITTPSPNHTGASAETNITSYNFVIPANTLSDGDTLRIENMLWQKIGVANTSFCRVKLSNTNNFATASQVAIFFNSSANIYMRACRTFNINSGLLRGVSFTANAIFNDFTITNLGFSTLALDFTQPIYGFISLQLTNPADIILMRELKIRKIRKI